MTSPSIRKRLEVISRLQPGWLDGTGEIPRPVHRQRVERLCYWLLEHTGLDRPFVYPTSSGGLQLEWDIESLGTLEMDLKYVRGGWRAVLFADWIDDNATDEISEKTDLLARVRAVMATT